MDTVLNISISLQDLKILVNDILSEKLLDYFEKNDKTNDGFLTYSQVFEKFYIKPERLIEWKMMGIINEYPDGKVVRFKMSELFKAIQTAVSIYKQDIKKEVACG